jgi:hypothetical protein
MTTEAYIFCSQKQKFTFFARSNPFCKAIKRSNCKKNIDFLVTFTEQESVVALSNSTDM